MSATKGNYLTTAKVRIHNHLVSTKLCNPVGTACLSITILTLCRRSSMDHFDRY